MENTQQNPTDEHSASNDPSHASSNRNNHTKQHKSMIYEFQWFPMTTSPWIASIAFLFQILFPIHMIDFYGDSTLAVFGVDSSAGSFRLISPFIVTGIQSIAYSFNSIISALCIITLLFNKSEELQGYKYILGWLGSKIFPMLRYIIDINVAIAAIFLIRTPLVAVFFVLTAITNLTISFFCQNYTLRKDYLCCKSMQYMMMWRICLILGYAASCAGYYLIGSSKVALIIFLVILFLLAGALLVCYFLFGYLIYRHTSSQLVLLLLLNTFFSISAGNLYDAFLTLLYGNFVPNRNLIFAGCFFAFVACMMYSLWTNIKKKGSLNDNKDPIKKIYFIFNKLENSSQNISDDCEIRGIIRYHLSHACKNQSCFINQPEQSYYDSKKNKFCHPSKLNQGKTSFVKFIAKCIYEQQLDNIKWDSTDLLLDYIEFYFMKLKNLFQVTYLLVELEKKFLTPFQRLRLTRLRRVMLQQNRKLNQELYNGSLDIQNLIVSENKFDEIQQQLKEVLIKNMEFWKYIENYSINLSAMVKMIGPTFSLIDKINSNWKCIAKYFEIQKVWKFVFVCYTLYFRNEKLKPQLIEQFGQSVHQDDLFVSESLHIDKTSDPGKIYASKMIFEQDVCCVHINHSQEKPVIKSVSRYFERIFGYQNSEIIQSSLDLMMAPCFQKFHRARFLKWAGQGMSNKQNNYEVKKVFPTNKSGYIVSTFKFYKQYLCLNRQLQYVAMFKKNKQEEQVLILNDNYEIEGMTQSFSKKIGLNNNQYKSILGLNLLIFLPGLIEYTKFDQEKQNIMDSILGVLEIDRRTTITMDYSQKSRTKRPTINSKKQFTKSNLQFTIPQQFEGIIEAYSTKQRTNNKQSLGSPNGSTVLNRVLRSYSELKEISRKRKYKVEIQARMIEVDEHTYIEFYITEMENVERVADGKSMEMSGQYEKKSMESYIYQSAHNEQLSKFFQNSHNSQNISLAFNDNIFIKEDNNQPVEMISYVKSISTYIRIVFVLFFGLLVGSLLFEYNNYDQYKQNSQKTYAVVELQLKLLMLDHKYHSLILDIPGSMLSVDQLTQSLQQIRQKNIQFKKSILDLKMNNPQTFNIIQNGQPSSYDQIDVIDKTFINIIQILYKLEGNPEGTDAYTSFQQIMVPSIQVLTTNVIDNISAVFYRINQRIDIKNYGYISIGLALLITAFLLVFSRLLRVSRSFVSLMQIFTQFNQADLKKIIRYCANLQQLFNHLSSKYDMFKQREPNQKQLGEVRQTQRNNSSNGSYSLKAGSTQVDGIVQDDQEEDNANLNKKVKKVQNGKELDNLKFRSIIYVVIFLILYGMASFGLNMYTSLINKQIIAFKDTGHQIFQYYSSINIYYLSMKDRSISQQNYNPSRYSAYKDKIAEMKRLKYQQGNSLYQDYITLRNQIIFSNVCDLYPDVVLNVGYTQQQCGDIAENNMQHGVQSYMFYMSSNVDYFNAGANYTIDTTLAYNMEVGMEMSNLYLQYLLQQWAAKFSTMMDTLQRNIIIICSGLFVFQIIIYIVLIQVFIVGNLKNKFMFFKKIYNNMMPDFIITKEKIIKAKLEVQGFIQK